MLEKLISASVNNKFIVLLFTFGLCFWGIYSLLHISIDAVPDITNNQVQIVTVSPSLAAKEVEQFITFPIEAEMANVQNTEEIRSISRYGLSVITVVFKENVPVLDARQLVGQQLQVARQEIPDGFGEPFLMPITTGLGEIYQYTLEVEKQYQNRYSIEELRTIHDWIIKRQLNGIPGIVEISSFGGLVKQYEVAVDPQVLSNFNLTLLDVNKALQKNNQNTGGSYLKKGPYAYYIKTEGLISTMDDIRNIVVTNRDNIPILISDIGEVRIGSPPRFGAMTKDGKGEAVGGITLMLKGGNASEVISEVKERINLINRNLPQGIHIQPYLDRAVLVDKVISTVFTNLIEGGLIVIFILVLLLGNLRAGLIVASVIPLSMLFAFGMMHAFGITATVMSLGAIDFGLIVDATVIIIESIIFQLERIKDKMDGRAIDLLVTETTQKIRNSAAFGAFIILIVYFPILALTGIEGKMFRPMALTVSFAIIGALILSFTYIPVMSALFLKNKMSHKATIADKIMNLFYKSYKPVFELALKNKILVVVVAIMLFISSILIFNRLGAEFLPDLDEGDLAMQMTIPTGSTLDESIKTSTKAEKILLDNFPEVMTVVSKIGTAEVPTDPMAIEDADIMIILKPRTEWTSAENRAELADKMKQKLSQIAGASFEFTQPIQLRFNELLTGAKADVVLKIYGEDLNILFSKANDAAKIISTVEGAADVKVEQVEGLPQLVIQYNRNQIAKYGLNIEEINTLVRTALAGENVGNIFEGERKFDLVVRLNSQYRNNYEAFNNLFIKTPEGNQVPIHEVAELKFLDSPVQISRDNTHRRISVGINVRNRDVQSVVEDIQQKISAQLKIPFGYYITYGGKFENLQSAMLRLKIVVPIALLLIFILLYFTFQSFKYSFNILTTIPMSIIGGIIALWVRGLPFSISAGIGFIALFGVAVLDGIVLINQLNELKKSGLNDINERLRRATKTRLRPVLVTSAVASLGFLPMAVSTSAGAEVQRPLATVVIGGIITSTFLTMIVLPIVYYYFEAGFRIKSRKVSKVLTCIILLGLSPALVAQNDGNIRKVSLEEAIQIYEENNLDLKNAELSINSKQYLQKKNLDFGRTELDYQYGQLNSAFHDYSFSVKQNFGNYLQNICESKYATYETELLTIKKDAMKQQHIHQIKLLYNSQQSLDAKKQLIDSLVSHFEKYIEIAQKQYEAGVITQLEYLNLNNNYQHYLLMRAQIANDNIQAAFQLQKVLQSNAMVRFQKDMYKLFEYTFDTLEAVSTHNNLVAKIEQKKSQMAEQGLAVKKTVFFPELYAGFFNQQIDGSKGFSGIEAGISFPLFPFYETKTIQAEKINIEVQQNKTVAQRNEVQHTFNMLMQQIQLRKDELENFEQVILENATLIEQQANLLYNNYEISYYEYLQSIENAVHMRLNYIDKISDANKLILQLQLLLK